MQKVKLFALNHLKEPELKKHFKLFILLLFAGQLASNAQVNCAFTASVLSGCAPLSVNFQDQSIGATTYQWQFDNGNSPSTLRNATTNYPLPGIYNVRHVAFNGAASDTAYLQIRVFNPPTVNFMSPNPQGCNSPCHTANFVNQTIPGESAVSASNYVWNFGDGTGAEIGYNVNHCFSQAGSFNITLIALDNNGCQVSKTIPNYVTIRPGPVATATANPTQSCLVSQLVNFAGTGSSPAPPVTYSWNFGNGSSSAQNPVQPFTCGVYNPVLTVTDQAGCNARDTLNIQIPCLNAGFTATSTNGCLGIPVQFTDTSIYASSWSWDFGDGSPVSTAQHPAHTYNSNGAYTVTLTVTYAGCADTESKTSYINITSPVSFTLSGDDYSNCTAPFTVNFSSNAPGATSYNWNFGDSNISTLANPSHTYTTEGTFIVTLSVTNSTGCVNTQTLTDTVYVGGIHAGFTIDSLHGCTPAMINFTDTSTSNVAVTSYYWQFGDSTANAAAQHPIHMYTVGGEYVPTLTVQNADGCISTYVSPDTIKIGTALVPSFVAFPLIQCVNHDVSFTNLTADTTSATEYYWEFGDHQSSTEFSPTHQYSDTGSYTVSLTVINQGCSSTLTKPLYILIVVPKADFGYSSACINPTNFAFTDSSQGADIWAWNFGDGSPVDSTKNPTHVFAAEGVYSVTLTVTNITTGCTDFKNVNLMVGTPHANFIADTIAGCIPLTIQFSDTSAFAADWFWNFGDNTTSTERNPTHTFSDTGRFTIQLTINQSAACPDSLRKVDYITAYGIKPRIGVSDNYGCMPFPILYTNLSTSFGGSIISTYWNFANGDDTTTTTLSTLYTYNVVGIFASYLRTYDSHGCSAIIWRNVESTIIKADFASDTIACPGEEVRFSSEPIYSPAISNFWNFGDGVTSTAANPSHSFTSSGNYTVSLISTNAAGCKDTVVKSNVIEVNSPKADFYVTTNFSPCPPFPVKFYNSSSRSDLNWLWYFGDGDTSTDKDPLHVYFMPGDYDVTLIAWNPMGCRDTITYIDLIRVRGPVGNFIATPDSGCVPLTISITGTVQQSTVSIIADLGDGTAYNDITSVVHTYENVGNYYPVFTLTDSLGCQVSYHFDTIVVGLIPYPNLNDTTVCRGNNVLFNLPLGDHFEWTTNASQTYLTCDTCRRTISSSLDTITYYVTAMTNIGCVAKDTVTVNVDALPQIYPGLFYRICPNDTLQLSAGPQVAAATWQPSLYMNDSTLISPLVWPPDTITYRVTGSNSTGCSISRIVKVFPIDKVSASLTSDGDTIKCEGGTVSMNVDVLQSSFNDTTFQWIPATYLNSSTIKNPVLTAPAGDYTYQVIVRSTTCEADTETIHITFAPTPAVEAGDDQTVAEGTTIQLWASSLDQVTYTWLPTGDSISCIGCRRPYLIATKEQLVPVVVTSEYGCVDTAFVHIRVVACDDKMVFVPNAFTPNNDGVNDNLYVRGGGLRSLEYFRVFDRWGKMVFETQDINQGWDGTINGRKADIATFVYIVKGVCSSGADVLKSGNVTLVR